MNKNTFIKSIALTCLLALASTVMAQSTTSADTQKEILMTQIGGASGGLNEETFELKTSQAPDGAMQWRGGEDYDYAIEYAPLGTPPK